MSRSQPGIGAAPGREAEGQAGAVKAAILDQRTVAASEHLRRRGALASADPSARTGRCTRPGRGPALHRGIHRALQAGCGAGSTLRDYRLPNGGTSGAPREGKVYGRAAAVRTLWHPDRQSGRQSRDVVLPSCQRLAYAASDASSRPSRARRQEPSSRRSAPSHGCRIWGTVIRRSDQCRRRRETGVVVEVNLLVGEADPSRSTFRPARSSRTSGSIHSIRASRFTTRKAGIDAPEPALTGPNWRRTYRAGDRPAFAALLGGRPDPAHLHRTARSDRCDREGRAADQSRFGAGWSRSRTSS